MRTEYCRVCQKPFDNDKEGWVFEVREWDKGRFRVNIKEARCENCVDRHQKGWFNPL